MESVKSIVKDVVYGKSKIHTNMEFTFANNKNTKNKLYRFINMYKSVIIGYEIIVVRLKIVQIKERGKGVLNYILNKI